MDELKDFEKSPMRYERFKTNGTTNGIGFCTPGLKGRWHNSYGDAWNDVRWHELASCGAWYDAMV